MRFYAEYYTFGIKILQGDISRNKDLIRRYHSRAVISEYGSIVISIGKIKIILT